MVGRVHMRGLEVMCFATVDLVLWCSVLCGVFLCVCVCVCV